MSDINTDRDWSRLTLTLEIFWSSQSEHKSRNKWKYPVMGTDYCCMFEESHWLGKSNIETEFMCNYKGKDSRGDSTWLLLFWSHSLFQWSVVIAAGRKARGTATAEAGYWNTCVSMCINYALFTEVVVSSSAISPAGYRGKCQSSVNRGNKMNYFWTQSTWNNKSLKCSDSQCPTT